MSYAEKEVVAMLNEMNVAFGDFKARYDKKIEDMETVLGRSNFRGGGSSRSGGITEESKEHHGRFFNWFRKGTDQDSLHDFEIKAGLSTVDDPSGGFTVPEELSRSLDKLAIDSVAMRRLASIVTASGDYKRLLSSGGATGGWVGELETREETDTPELKQFNPPWSEWYGLPEVSQTLLDDSGLDIEAWLLDELRDVETTMEGTAFISGSGVKQPKGFLSYAMVPNASWEWGKIGYIAGAHATLLNNADKLRSLKYALKPIYRKQGIFLMNDSTQEVISNFKDGNGNYIWKEGLTEDAPDTLLGRPVEIDDNMDDIGENKYPLAFADWKRGYLIGDHKVGRRLLRDPFTKKGFVKFYLTKRTFGGVINHQSIKLLKISES